MTFTSQSQVKLYLNDLTTKIVIINETSKDSLKALDMDGIKSVIYTKDITKQVNLQTTLNLGFDKNITGVLLDVTNDSYSIYVNDGFQIIPKNIVVNIKFSEIKDKYVSLGFVLGTPAVYNLVLSYNAFKSAGFRVSGLTFISENTGYQIEFFYNLSNSKNFESNISIMKGESKFIDLNNSIFVSKYKRWNYYGAGIDFNYYGLFGQFSFTSGKGDFPSPQLGFQLGYVYRFNK